MNILIVSPFFPFPQSHGDAIRRLMLIERIVQHPDVTRVTIVTEAGLHTSSEDIEALAEIVSPASLIVGTVGGIGSTRRVGRFPGALRRRVPPWVLGQVGSLSGFDFSEFHDVDVVFLVGESAGFFAAGDLARFTVWDKSNVLAASDLDSVRHLKAPLTRLRSLLRFPLSFLFERRVLKSVDQVWVTSSQERSRLVRLYGIFDCQVVPSCIPMNSSDVAEAPLFDNHSNEVLWMSNLGYPPNWDGLISFLEVTSALLIAMGVRVRVVGAGASREQVGRLETYSVVNYVGYVDDLAQGCARVRCAVVPVWAGAGVKLKTLTLMSLGIPVIATPVSMEGIPNSAAWAVASDPQEFGDLLTDFFNSSCGVDFVRDVRERILAEFGLKSFQDNISRRLDEIGKMLK